MNENLLNELEEELIDYLELEGAIGHRQRTAHILSVSRERRQVLKQILETRQLVKRAERLLPELDIDFTTKVMRYIDKESDQLDRSSSGFLELVKN